jgi:hypothetical protein
MRFIHQTPSFWPQSQNSGSSHLAVLMAGRRHLNARLGTAATSVLDVSTQVPLGDRQLSRSTSSPFWLRVTPLAIRSASQIQIMGCQKAARARMSLTSIGECWTSMTSPSGVMMSARWVDSRPCAGTSVAHPSVANQRCQSRCHAVIGSAHGSLDAVQDPSPAMWAKWCSMISPRLAITGSLQSGQISSRPSVSSAGPTRSPSIVEATNIRRSPSAQ